MGKEGSRERGREGRGRDRKRERLKNGDMQTLHCKVWSVLKTLQGAVVRAAPLPTGTPPCLPRLAQHSWTSS